MKHLLVYIVLLSFFISLKVGASEQQEPSFITFGVIGYSTVKFGIYRQQVKQFEQLNPGVKVRLVSLVSRNYPELLTETLAMKDKVDVLNWFPGDRMKTLVKHGMVVDINPLWQQQKFDKKFAASFKYAASIGDKVYGVPITSYVWGLYYKKALFERLKLNVPNNWQEFKHVMQVLQDNSIAPVALGTRYPWQIAGWFDYIVLRLHGAEFYQRLVNGEISFKSKEMYQVFEYWQQILKNRYIFAQHKFYDGEELMPLLYREVVGMNLIGSFVLSTIPQNLQDEIGFFPFPQMSENNDNSVLSPLSVIALTKSGRENPAAQKLLTYFAEQSTQQQVNQRFNTLSPMNEVAPEQESLMYQSYLVARAAKYNSQYFDIEFPYEMAEFAKAEFKKFIDHQNVEQIVVALENKRLDLQP